MRVRGVQHLPTRHGGRSRAPGPGEDQGSADCRPGPRQMGPAAEAEMDALGYVPALSRKIRPKRPSTGWSTIIRASRNGPPPPGGLPPCRHPKTIGIVLVAALAT